MYKATSTSKMNVGGELGHDCIPFTILRHLGGGHKLCRYVAGAACSGAGRGCHRLGLRGQARGVFCLI